MTEAVKTALAAVDRTCKAWRDHPPLIPGRATNADIASYEAVLSEFDAARADLGRAIDAARADQLRAAGLARLI
jgi:hypothetical protein